MASGGDSDHRSPGAGESLSHWVAAFVGGTIVSSLVLMSSGHAGSTTAEVPTWVFALSACAMWGTSLVVVHRYVNRARGTTFRAGLGLQFRPADGWGIVLGIASQLVLVNVVNWPLSRLFPDTFNFDDISRRARDLADASRGGWVVVLVVIVVIGAPVVEEIVYRGMVQPGLESSWGAATGTIVTAVLFAAIHFVPIEFPGLLAFALVLGWTRHRTGRLGLAIVTHMAFNAAGLGFALLG